MIYEFLDIDRQLAYSCQMQIGYARVSTHDQSLDLQRDALLGQGCEKIFVDIASGTNQDRTGIEQLREQLRSGDVIVVWRLDRLGRSLKQLIELVEEFKSLKVGFRSLTEAIDTTTPGGKLFFHIIASMAEFERNIIAERTRAGLAAARSRGKLGGRPRKLSMQQCQIVQKLYVGKELSINDICKMFKISKTTLYSYLKCRERENNKTRYSYSCGIV